MKSPANAPAPPNLDIAALAAGSNQAWSVFLDSHEHSFLRAAWNKCRNWDDAREAVHDALQAAIKKLAEGCFDETGVEHFKNYIFFLVKTRGSVSRGARRLAGEEEFDFDKLADSDPAMDRLLANDEIDLAKRMIPELLTPREQFVIVSLFLGDAPLSNREISAKHGIPYGTVCSDRSRALEKLRQGFLKLA